ncbi:MAG: D-alanine--D-alanine ligase [Planctomycetes bacterium]|nr:D-alanine--D-alanine ligase [Planctomycetota bacterium]MBU4398295.1 D-alanine--D-alanine ligase [Planctomycetota bacterium]MCG2682977.1 D-alanine--D-alanine ligase [Planctomycetales bacterium]
MHIGLTYDLRDDYLAEGYSEEETAEFDRPDTIEAIEAALDELGYRTDRIGNARRLIARLAQGDRWDLVFNIAEGLRGLSREAQAPAILDVYDIPYTFSDPLVLSLSLHKGLTNTVLRQAGIPTPDFALVERPADVDAVDLPFPLFVKPAAEGTSKGISANSIIRDRQALRAACSDLLLQFHQPVLVETFLSGREFTVGLIGSGPAAKALGTMEIHLLPEAEAEVYSYTNKERCEDLVRYRLAGREEDPLISQVEEIAVTAWRTLGGRDGGRVDVRCDAQGRPHFLEVNPLPGLHPHHSDLPILCGFLGVSYVDLIDRIVSSARRRMKVNCKMQIA